MDGSKQSNKKEASSFGQGLLAILVIGYMLVTLGFSVFKNYKVNQEISDLKIEIETIKAKSIQLENEIVYYQTKSYVELEGRRRLGLKKPDETIVIAPENRDIVVDNQTDGSVSPDKPKMPDSDEPNYQKWYRFIFSNNETA